MLKKSTRKPVSEAAVNKLRGLWKLNSRKPGYNYHQAALDVHSLFPKEKLTSLRYKAYAIWKAHDYKTERIQHKANTLHGKILRAIRKKLRSKGYYVVTEQNNIRRAIKKFGASGSPDILAIRKPFLDTFGEAYAHAELQGLKMQDVLSSRIDDNIILVEVDEHGKEQGFLMNQIGRYSNIGKLIIVLPVDTKNIELWGTQNLDV